MVKVSKFAPQFFRSIIEDTFGIDHCDTIETCKLIRKKCRSRIPGETVLNFAIISRKAFSKLKKNFHDKINSFFRLIYTFKTSGLYEYFSTL